jgi:hypothetical protein
VSIGLMGSETPFLRESTQEWFEWHDITIIKQVEPTIMKAQGGTQGEIELKPRGTSGSSSLRSDGSLDRKTGRLGYMGVAKGKTRKTTIVEPTHVRWFSGSQVEKAGLREQHQKDIQEKPKDQGGLPRLKSTQIRWFLW